jgi:predicted DNA binding CopG/RHH family protein
MNRDFNLEQEEKELLSSYERNEWRSVDRLPEQLHQYQAYAIASLEAAGLVGIALPQEDIQAIREQATSRGVSYQTLIADVVHRYVVGDLVEKPRDG